MTQDYLSKFKNYFQSNKRGCPECGADIGKNARICPECGHNFMVEVEIKQPALFHFNFNMENCCSIFLVILIIFALLLYFVPFLKTFFFVIGAVLAAIAIVAALLLWRFASRISKVFERRTA